MSLAADATVVIPIATILGPMPEMPLEIIRNAFQDVETGEVQEIIHCDASNSISQLAMIGPSIWPKGFKFDETGAASRQEIHQIDLSTTPASRVVGRAER